MARKGESATLSLTPEEMAELGKIAKQFNFMWGDRPNVSALIKAIANRKLVVNDSSALPEEIDKSRIKAALCRLQKEIGELAKQV